jgi:hypothetical protein
MKKLLTLVFCVSNLIAFAGDRKFLQAEAGYGLGKITSKFITNSNFAGNADFLVSYGFVTNGFTMTAGLGYLKTGYSVPIVYTDISGNVIATENQATVFDHILIPVYAGYSFAVGKKTTLTPKLGFGITFNVSGRIKTKEPAQGGGGKDLTISINNFGTLYNGLSVFGLGRLEVEHQLSKRIGLLIAPSFDYMLTNMLIRKVGGSNGNQHNYSILLNAGVRWYFGERKTPAAKP